MHRGGSIARPAETSGATLSQLIVDRRGDVGVAGMRRPGVPVMALAVFVSILVSVSFEFNLFFFSRIDLT